MSFTVVDHGNENVSTFDSRQEAEDKAAGIKQMINNPNDIQVVDGAYDSYNDYQSDESDPVDPEIVDHSPTADTTDNPVDPDVLAQDPIEWLESQNTDFVNTIKGTPAISKQGFRFIQQRFGIRTESNVVETFTNPRGVIVWARAERPDGQYAEAHGEGYISESDVDDNEFVRYADTRAKNRAISDLTSAGALAVSELGEQ